MAETDYSTESKKMNSEILEHISNSVSDLQMADYRSFDRHIKKLSRLLHSTEVAAITDSLTKEIDFKKWLADGYETHGGMVGSAKIEWPDEPNKEMGTIILLVDFLADDEKQAIGFANRFFYVDNNYTDNLQHLVEQVLIPFARDYIYYAETNTKASERMPETLIQAPLSKKIFVVHGHDTGPRESVARFLEKLGFDPIILHEQANKGRTIIEKFEDHADVGFALILLTPDDAGGKKAGKTQNRARQNVILELGYFMGRLGRDRVCALKCGELEVPSDILGVVWVSFDENNGWKQDLSKELKAAGYQIDWNLVVV